MLKFTFSHVEYATADEIGEDFIGWMAGLVDIPNWPAGKEFAIACVTTAEGPVGYFTEDVEYARMLEKSQQAGMPLTLSDEVAMAKFPYNRFGWPGDWIGLNPATGR
ncbi:hypothetical protein [Streptomyces rubiginosohelvolus]|uniref:hypothetical protein n=1 Tax=Streptomyces rubiginosohelvolus TaxID=67362 RepID=UPI003666320B